MQLLLDTHALLWWLGGDSSLSREARSAIADAANGIYVSAASTWEIATKHRIGRLPGVALIAGDLESAILAQDFIGLPISIRHGQVAGALPGPHRDPFDRMLIAQPVLQGICVERGAWRRRIRGSGDGN